MTGTRPPTAIAICSRRRSSTIMLSLRGRLRRALCGFGPGHCRLECFAARGLRALIGAHHRAGTLGWCTSCSAGILAGKTSRIALALGRRIARRRFEPCCWNGCVDHWLGAVAVTVLACPSLPNVTVTAGGWATTGNGVPIPRSPAAAS